MLMGNLTRDVELRYTPKQTAVADIGLACNRVRYSEDGQKIEEVTFVDVTLWGKTAELANQYLGKGKPVFIEGRLQMDSWQDASTGKQRTKLKVVGESMQFIGAPGGSGGGQRPPQQGGAPAPQSQQPQQYQQAPQQQAPQQQPPQGGSPASSMPDFVDDSSDDIPF